MKGRTAVAMLWIIVAAAAAPAGAQNARATSGAATDSAAVLDVVARYHRALATSDSATALRLLTRTSDGWKISAIHWSSRSRGP